MVRRGGEIERLEATGTPIGILPGADYTTRTTRLDEGDLLVLYTDGINEAENAEDEQYGVDRLAAACRKSLDLTLDELAEVIEADLALFVGPVPFADDRTTVLIRRNRA